MPTWALDIPDQVLWILDIMNPGNPGAGDVKDDFLPAEGIYFDVLAADAHLYLGQRVWLGVLLPAVVTYSWKGIYGYTISASICFTEVSCAYIRLYYFLSSLH